MVLPSSNFRPYQWPVQRIPVSVDRTGGQGEEAGPVRSGGGQIRADQIRGDG